MSVVRSAVPLETDLAVYLVVCWVEKSVDNLAAWRAVWWEHSVAVTMAALKAELMAGE